MAKRFIALVLIAFCSLPAFCAVNAVFRDVTGKVEVNDGKGWKPAKAGLAIVKGSTISTGFNSKATIELGPSVLFVKPLTRMKLEELIEKEGIVKTELFLDVGRITAEVKTGGGIIQDFRLKSPVSTAAVRGTTIDFAGENIKLIKGGASGYNGIGQHVLLHEGDEISFEDKFDKPKGSKTRERGFTINPHTFSDTDVGAIGGKFASTTIVIILDW